MQFDAPFTPLWAVSITPKVIPKPVVTSDDDLFFYPQYLHHEIFGGGRIIEHLKYKEVVIVYFPQHGLKTLLLKWADFSFRDIRHSDNCWIAHPYFYDDILFVDYTNSFVLDLTMAKGGRQVNIWCMNCSYISKPQKKELWPLILSEAEHVAVVKRNRKEHELHPCSYRGCQNYGDHRHHWAPRNTFGYIEADNWPTSYLCPEHHREWHNKMNGYRTNNKSKDSA